MPRSSKVDHMCPVPAGQRDFEKRPSTEFNMKGMELNEVYRCKSCGYEFEVRRIVKKVKILGRRLYH